MSKPAIYLENVQQNNLKIASLVLPHNELIAVTGVSGSGKSSLVRETIAAYAQRRFLESLAASNSFLLEQVPRPKVDCIKGLPPVIDVSPPVRRAHPRSTLGTITDIHDFLQLLYSHAGTGHCPKCNDTLNAQTVSHILNSILQGSEKQKVMILAPIANGSSEEIQKGWSSLSQHGFVRARLNGTIIETDGQLGKNLQTEQTLEAVVDRIILKPGVETRLRESIETAIHLSNGFCLAVSSSGDDWEERLFQTKYHCRKCEISLPNFKPEHFSFWSPHGACPNCTGLGTTSEGDTTENQQCDHCEGSRLNSFARSVLFYGKSIDQFSALDIHTSHQLVLSWIDNSSQKSSFDDATQTVVNRLLPEIESRLDFLIQVGLEYLTLDRAATSLSSGEFQRARLAASLGSGLSSVCYTLDEPSAGLHAMDVSKLLTLLKSLNKCGNSVIMVEHHRELIRAADRIIDLGPGAGKAGGTVVASCTPSECSNNKNSVTGRFLNNTSKNNDLRASNSSMPTVATTVPTEEKTFLKIVGAKRHNLKNLTVSIPLQKLVCITGVSGSGKSTLIAESLYPAARAILQRKPIPKNCCLDMLEGMESIQQVRLVDQSPIGQNGRSNPATVTGLWTEIRKLFATTRTARARGYSASRFSFNSRDGQCTACKGTGEQQSRSGITADLVLKCPLCAGRRFNTQTLSVYYNNQSVADILEMSIDEAAGFFEPYASLKNRLNMMQKLGLGYLLLGQSAATLSSGEAQRLKLAVELGTQLRKTLLILDEPTRGLHLSEVLPLIEVLKEIVDAENSILIIEHQLDLISASDWLIDIGPKAGESGGTIVASGSPNAVCKEEIGDTAKALHAFF